MATQRSDPSRDGQNADDRRRTRLLSQRLAYARFSSWLDRELENLVARWAHTAAPNALRQAPQLRRPKPR